MKAGISYIPEILLDVKLKIKCNQLSCAKLTKEHIQVGHDRKNTGIINHTQK